MATHCWFRIASAKAPQSLTIRRTAPLGPLKCCADLSTGLAASWLAELLVELEVLVKLDPDDEEMLVRWC